MTFEWNHIGIRKSKKCKSFCQKQEEHLIPCTHICALLTVKKPNNAKQNAAGIRNWRRAQAMNIYSYLLHAGYPALAIDIKHLLTRDAERKWERDKKEIEKNPNYRVPI